MNRGNKEEQLVKGPLVLYEQMRLKVLQLIEERDIAPHEPIPSEGELADMFGVSRRTSKQALELLAKEGVVYRMPRRGTFLAEPEAAKKLGESDKMPWRAAAIVVPKLDDFIGEVVSAALLHAQDIGIELQLRITGGEQQAEEAILRDLANSRRIAGIIYFPGDRRNCGHEVLRLHLSGYPFVLVDRVFREINISAICHDHERGAYEMASHLIAMGHRRIGFVSEPIAGVVSREERYQGFLRALLDHQYTFPASRLFDQVPLKSGVEEHESNPGAANSLQDFIRNTDATALFCANDHVAANVLYSAMRLGIAVPGSLSITGFTDLPIASQAYVPLTTVRKSTQELGLGAVELLKRRIEHRDREPEQVRLDTSLVVRNSVGTLSLSSDHE